jgi:hypothetical protein
MLGGMTTAPKRGLYLGGFMIRKVLLPGLIVLTLTLVAVKPILAAKTYYAERFDAQFDLQPDGSAFVTETVVFRFEGGPFTYAFREIDQTETDGVSFLEASMDGVANASQVEVATGNNRLKVTWRFAPTSDTTHEFVVRYSVTGIVRKLEADTIRWWAIPQDHDYSIKYAWITLIYPDDVRPIEQPTLTRNFAATPLPNGIRLTTTGIRADQGVILIARFAAGAAAPTAPQWQIRQRQADEAASRALLIGILAALATLTLGGFGLLAWVYANRRDLLISTVLPSGTPPGDMPPALVGKLTRHSHAFMGALFDLAQRGALEVRQDKGWFGSKKYRLERKTATVSLRPHEQGLLDAVFKRGETRVEVSEISSRLVKSSGPLEALLEKELIAQGWLDSERSRQHAHIAAVGVLTMLAAISLFIVTRIGWGVALANDGNWMEGWAALTGIAAGGFVISIGLIIYYNTFSTLTPAGEEEAARWKGYAAYLKQASLGYPSHLPPDYFERHLPFAAAFGLGSAWAKRFQRVSGTPVPVWFHALTDSNSDFGAMVDVMDASDSAGASGGDGGGGGSGGGSSGAG